MWGGDSECPEHVTSRPRKAQGGQDRDERQSLETPKPAVRRLLRTVAVLLQIFQEKVNIEDLTRCLYLNYSILY